MLFVMHTGVAATYPGPVTHPGFSIQTMNSCLQGTHAVFVNRLP